MSTYQQQAPAARIRELEEVLRAVQQSFNEFEGRMPDGFGRKLFRWVDDALAGVKMEDDERERLLLLIEGASNLLRGMTLDPAIPKHAKDAMWHKINELEAALEKYQ